MQAPETKGSVDGTEDGGRSCAGMPENPNEVNRLRDEIQEAVYYFRWWRFLDYDPKSIEFLEKLDMPRSANPS